MTFRLKRFVDKQLMCLQYEFQRSKWFDKRSAIKVYPDLKYFDGTKCLKKAGKAWKINLMQVTGQLQEPETTNNVCDIC